MKDSTTPLTPAMERALRNGARDNFAGVFECTMQTEGALIRRGLAEGIRGSVSRHNRYSHFAQTVYDTYLGIRFTEAGIEAAQRLISNEEN